MFTRYRSKRDNDMASLWITLLVMGATLPATVALDRQTDTANKTLEFCPNEEFVLECPTRHKLHIVSARWGRMRYDGRCKSRSPYQIVSCAQDVTQVIQEMCGSSSYCSSPPLTDFNRRFPACARHVTSYLEVTYLCRPTTSPSASTLIQVSEPIVQEVCHLETFNTECAGEERIHIASARYGRMRIGRCIQSSLGLFGCSQNVTSNIQELCEGSHNCSVSAHIDLQDVHRPCPPDLTSYLEVIYECQSPAAQTLTITVKEEGMTVSLGCPAGQQIHLLGRWLGEMKLAMNFTQYACSRCLEDKRDLIAVACEGKATCEVNATAMVEGSKPDVGQCRTDGNRSACVHVEYMCVPEEGEVVATCPGEKFSPRCGNQMVRIKRARYGRMAAGRCADPQYGPVNCSVDVLDYVRSKCEGHHKCDLDVTDRTLLAHHPCGRELLAYLGVQYSCGSILGEACFGDTLLIRCNRTRELHNQLLIESAEWGRMELSRCAQKDHGALGCAADVTALVRSTCRRGRLSCTLDTLDPKLMAASNCPRDVAPYLRVRYTCY